MGPSRCRSLVLALCTSAGRELRALVVKEVVMSDARRRKSAVWAMAENGVVGFCVDKKLVSQAGDGERALVEVRCADT